MTLQSAITNLVSKVIEKTAILIGIHNTNTSSHNDIRVALDTKAHVDHVHNNLASTTYIDSEIADIESDLVNHYVNQTVFNAHGHETLNFKTSIPANSDLNDYTTVGLYDCSKTNSSTLTHKPFESISEMILDVKSYANNVVIQIVYMLTSDSNQAIYFRVFENNVWTAWKKVFDEYSIDNALSNSSTKPVQNQVIKSALDGKESTSNKVTTISSSNTNDQYPSALAVYNSIANFSTDINLENVVRKSSTSGLLKNDGTVDTTSYLTEHQDLSGKANVGHTHVQSDLPHYDGKGTDGVSGYVKLLQIKIKSIHTDIPISFDIYQRGSTEPSRCSLVFEDVNYTDPSINSFTYTGEQRNIYIYHETSSIWSILIEKEDENDFIHINNVNTGHTYMDNKVEFTALNTLASTLPLSNITQATYIGITNTEKTKLAGIENQANKTIVDSSLSSSSTNPVQNKVINTALSGKASSSHTHGNIQNDGQVGSTAQANKNVVTDGNGKITTEDKPTIPSASSTNPLADTTNGSVGDGTTWAKADHTHPKSNIYAEASHAHGNIQNNGQIGSTAQPNKNVVTDGSGKITTEDKPTIPSASSTTPSADTNNGSVGNGTTWAKADHTHPKSTIYAEASHVHGNISNDGKIGSTANKPVITTTGGVLTTGNFGTSGGEFAEGNHTHNYQQPIVSEYYSLHSKFKLYRFGKVVTLHILNWTPAGQRDQYATLSLTIPEGYRPPQTIYLDDVVSNGMHIVIFSDGSMQQYVPGNVSANFFGHATWIVYDG